MIEEQDFACQCGCGLNNVSRALIRMLADAGISKINSGCRCEKHNEHVGGSKTSSHLLGLAVDIPVTSSRARFKTIKALIDAGFTRIGIGASFIHADIDPDKSQEVAWKY